MNELLTLIASLLLMGLIFAFLGIKGIIGFIIGCILSYIANKLTYGQAVGDD